MEYQIRGECPRYRLTGGPSWNAGYSYISGSKTDCTNEFLRIRQPQDRLVDESTDPEHPLRKMVREALVREAREKEVSAQVAQ